MKGTIRVYCLENLRVIGERYNTCILFGKLEGER